MRLLPVREPDEERTASNSVTQQGRPDYDFHILKKMEERDGSDDGFPAATGGMQW